MRKRIAWLLVLSLLVLLTGCDRQALWDEMDRSADSAAIGSNAVAATDSASVTEASGQAMATVVPAGSAGKPEAEGVSSFVQASVPELGIETMIPAGWPRIEGDSLLEHAWGPGAFTFIAFHAVPGDSVRATMAELVNATPEALLNGVIEGQYWETQAGSHDWGIYSIENSDVDLAQVVAMTEQQGTVYIVSLFVETLEQEPILGTALESFVITGEGSAVAVDGPTASEPGMTDLAGTSWVLTAYAQQEWAPLVYDEQPGEMVDVLPEQIVTIVFGADGRISGFSGCNNYASLYTAEGDRLVIEAPVVTRMACDQPPGIMKQEERYLDNLARVARFRSSGQDLQLLDDAGEVLLSFWTPSS